MIGEYDGTIRFDTKIDDSNLDSQMASLNGRLKSATEKLRDIMQGPVMAIQMIGAAVQKVKAAVSAMESEWAGQEKAVAILNSTLRATGASAWTSSAQLQAMASKLQDVTGYADDVIISMQGVLLGFKNIKGDNFKEASVQIINMARVMGMDLTSAAQAVGKALDDPINGVDSLSRQGFRFSDSQKEVLKSLVQAGKTAEAQKIILDELATTYGGAAEAANETGAALKDKLQVATSELNEELGHFLTDGLAPFRRELINNVNAIGDFFAKVNSNGSAAETLQKIATGLGAATAAVAAFVLVSKGAAIVDAMTKAIGAMNAALLANPYALAAAGIAALIVAISGYAKAQDEHTDALRRQVEKSGEAKREISDLAGEYQKLYEKVNPTATEQARMAEIAGTLHEKYPTLTQDTIALAAANGTLADETARAAKAQAEKSLAEYTASRNKDLLEAASKMENARRLARGYENNPTTRDKYDRQKADQVYWNAEVLRIEKDLEGAREAFNRIWNPGNSSLTTQPPANGTGGGGSGTTSKAKSQGERLKELDTEYKARIALAEKNGEATAEIEKKWLEERLSLLGDFVVEDAKIGIALEDSLKSSLKDYTEDGSKDLRALGKEIDRTRAKLDAIKEKDSSENDHQDRIAAMKAEADAQREGLKEGTARIEKEQARIDAIESARLEGRARQYSSQLLNPPGEPEGDPVAKAEKERVDAVDAERFAGRARNYSQFLGILADAKEAADKKVIEAGEQAEKERLALAAQAKAETERGIEEGVVAASEAEDAQTAALRAAFEERRATRQYDQEQKLFELEYDKVAYAALYQDLLTLQEAYNDEADEAFLTFDTKQTQKAVEADNARWKAHTLGMVAVQAAIDRLRTAGFKAEAKKYAEEAAASAQARAEEKAAIERGVAEAEVAASEQADAEIAEARRAFEEKRKLRLLEKEEALSTPSVKDETATMEEEYRNKPAPARQAPPGYEDPGESIKVQIFAMSDFGKALADIKTAWDTLDASITADAENWDDVMEPARAMLEDAFASAFETIGEAIVSGKADWAGWGAAALRSLAAVLKSLGYQLVAIAATKALMFDWVGAAIAMAAAAAAFVASGIVDELADQAEATSMYTDALDEENDSLKENRELWTKASNSANAYAAVLAKVKGAVSSFYQDLQTIGADIADILVDGLINGLSDEDFVYAMQEYITKAVIKAAVFTETFMAEVAAIGQAIADGVANGFSADQLQALRDRLAALYLSAAQSADTAAALVESVFASYDVGTLNVKGDQLARLHDTEMVLTPGIAEEARRAGVFIGPSSSLGGIGQDGLIPSTTQIRITSIGNIVLDGRVIGQAAWEHSDQFQRAAYGA